MMRIYDGRSCEWVELLLTRDVVQRWMPCGPNAGARALRLNPGLGDERAYLTRWLVNGVVVALSTWRPTQAQAERDMQALPQPSEHRCPSCDHQWLYTDSSNAAFICAACGAKHSWLSITRPAEERRLRMQLREEAIADALANPDGQIARPPAKSLAAFDAALKAQLATPGCIPGLETMAPRIRLPWGGWGRRIA